METWTLIIVVSSKKLATMSELLMMVIIVVDDVEQGLINVIVVFLTFLHLSCLCWTICVILGIIGKMSSRRIFRK